MSGSEACGDLTLRNADNTRLPGNAKQWRQENEPQCSFLFWVNVRFGERQAFLCSSSKMKKKEVTQEVNNVQNGVHAEVWKLPHRSCWHGSLDNRRGAHQTRRFRVANVSPSMCLHSARLGVERAAAFSSARVSLPSAASQVTVCVPSISSLRNSGERGLPQSESTLGCLMLITAIYHVRNFLPPRVCFDLFFSGAVTLKDEVPSGPAGTARAGSRVGSQRGAPRTGRRSSSQFHISAETE